MAMYSKNIWKHESLDPLFLTNLIGWSRCGLLWDPDTACFDDMRIHNKDKRHQTTAITVHYSIHLQQNVRLQWLSFSTLIKGALQRPLWRLHYTTHKLTQQTYHGACLRRNLFCHDYPESSTLAACVRQHTGLYGVWKTADCALFPYTTALLSQDNQSPSCFYLRDPGPGRTRD